MRKRRMRRGCSWEIRHSARASSNNSSDRLISANQQGPRSRVKGRLRSIGIVRGSSYAPDEPASVATPAADTRIDAAHDHWAHPRSVATLRAGRRRHASIRGRHDSQIDHERSPKSTTESSHLHRRPGLLEWNDPGSSRRGRDHGLFRVDKRRFEQRDVTVPANDEASADDPIRSDGA
jgi:hypothetical protein